MSADRERIAPAPPPRTARELAYRVLVRVERDRAFADLALGGLLRDSDLERRDRALATEIAYGALRMRGRIDAVLRDSLDRPFEHIEVQLRNLLRLGAYQLMFLRSVPDPVAVSETVALAKAVGLERAASLVNAVLRKVAIRHPRFRFPTLEEDPVGHLRDFGSLPEWLAERLVRELGPADATRLALVQTETPPRTVRLSPGADRSQIARRLGGEFTRYAPSGVTACASDPVRDPAFRAGEITVQDEASQLVPLLLGVQAGQTVVDCCAAPGTKTVQIAEMVGPRGEVVALELHGSRIPLIHSAAKRLGLHNVRALERDVCQGFDLQGRLKFPAILVDAPCSGLGTLRRNPDARWRVRESQIEHSADAQLAILGSAARYVELHGALVYSVCTTTPEETSGVIGRFLEQNPRFRVDDPRPFLPDSCKELVDAAGALRTWPHLHGCDGFFATRLVNT